MTSPCSACRKQPKRAGQYLCRSCWFGLSAVARQALGRRDDQAMTRLRQLLDQIADSVPLDRIQVPL